MKMEQKQNNNELLLKEILEAIYWKEFTNKQKTEIITLINNSNYTASISKANDICDFLDIEKRGNRRGISEIIDKYSKCQ